MLVCGAVFDGVSEELGAGEILVRDGLISEIGRSVDRPDGAEVIDLSERTVSPGFIDTHVHLTMDASNLAQQTLESSAAKALKGLEPRARVPALRLHDAARPRQHGSGVPDRRPAQRPQRRARAGPAADRRRPHHQRLGRPRRPARLLRLALGPAGVRDRRRRRGDPAAGAPRARLRLGLDQDRQRRRLLQRRRRSRPPHLVRRRDGGRVLHRAAARDAGRRAHRRRRGVQAGDPLRRPQPRARLPDRRGGRSTWPPRRRVHRADHADDPGGPRRAASRHAALPGRLEVQPRQPSRSSTPSGSWPPATPRWPSGPTAACSPSATASASSRRWSTPGSARSGRCRPAPRSPPSCSARDDIGVLKPGACADIVAMPGNPLDDIAATAQVDFVMRAGAVYRRPDDASPPARGPYRTISIDKDRTDISVQLLEK